MAMDACGPLWTISGGGGVERPLCKPLTQHLRVVAAEIRTPRCAPTLGSIPFASAALAGNAPEAQTTYKSIAGYLGWADGQKARSQGPRKPTVDGGLPLRVQPCTNTGASSGSAPATGFSSSVPNRVRNRRRSASYGG